MDGRIAAARAKLGATAVILGHHYQRDEVVRFADFTGDSYKLSKTAAATGAKYIVFCGVHFMAESADILAQNGQQVILPDLNAGCSMADMAEISQVEDCWDALDALGLADETIPVTYINSTAAIKAFCGEHGGLVCTSSSARAALEWGFARGKRILFLPDQHLGRNTGHAMGIPLEEMAVWDPWAVQIRAGRSRAGKRKSGSPRAAFCCGRATAPCISASCRRHVDQVRAKYPGIQVIVHPECRYEVCQKADALGSTEQLIAMRGAGAGGIDVCHRDGDSSGEPAGAGALRPKAKRSSRSTTPAACAPRCTASARSTWRGCSRILWKAAW